MKLPANDAAWRAKLTPLQYRVLRQKGTELPGSGRLLHNRRRGTYDCAACGSRLFTSDDKYISHTPGLIGWPSFSAAVDAEHIKLVADDSLGMRRTEVICRNCASHLGHLFADDDSPSGQHYCINSAALDFKSQTE